MLEQQKNRQKLECAHMTWALLCRARMGVGHPAPVLVQKLVLSLSNDSPSSTWFSLTSEESAEVEGAIVMMG